jgi:hypothetical protein
VVPKRRGSFGFIPATVWFPYARSASWPQFARRRTTSYHVNRTSRCDRIDLRSTRSIDRPNSQLTQRSTSVRFSNVAPHYEQVVDALAGGTATAIRRSPKLNGHVERAQRTHAEEFYDLHMG